MRLREIKKRDLKDYNIICKNILDYGTKTKQLRNRYGKILGASFILGNLFIHYNHLNKNITLYSFEMNSDQKFSPDYPRIEILVGWLLEGECKEFLKGTNYKELLE